MAKIGLCVNLRETHDPVFDNKKLTPPGNRIFICLQLGFPLDLKSGGIGMYPVEQSEAFLEDDLNLTSHQ